jgi:hypothetical protein
MLSPGNTGSHIVLENIARVDKEKRIAYKSVSFQI